MRDHWKKKWDDRYRENEHAFGEEPNEYLKEQLDNLDIGKILFAAEGDGRNSIYAGKRGWTVSAFDISIEGKNKAIKKAKKDNITIEYQVGELPNLIYSKNEFDAIALIYAHFPPDIKSHYHKLLDDLLRKGGVIIFEAFSKNHLKYRTENPKVGGLKIITLCFR